jgi:hypothetical protein
MRHRRILLVASLLAVGLTVSGCESFDPSDWFNPKKPLPGDRKAVFPEGVPGVPQGVPPELVRGYQPPPEPPPQVAETPPAEKPKPKPKPRPKQVAAPKRPAPAAAAQPTAQAPWPAPQQTAAQPAQPQTQSPFPDPPQPGSFRR